MEQLRIPTLAELRAIPNADYLRWSMYYARQAQRNELERLKVG
jgi:hypothetical protein